MQLTLVSHYGEKPREFRDLIQELQRPLLSTLGNNFLPYAVEQVHGTLVGLEGTATGNDVLSHNFLQLSGERRPFDFPGLLKFLRDDFAGFEIQIGGFHPDQDYGFTSQDKSPFLRSFSLRGPAAVAMGWPRQQNSYPLELDLLRRSLERFGALRKWAWRDGEIDNDFYFVLGQLREPIPQPQLLAVESDIRAHLSKSSHLLRVGPETLSFVAYSDLRLTPETSRVLKLSDCAITAQSLAEVYFCNR